MFALLIVPSRWAIFTSIILSFIDGEAFIEAQWDFFLSCSLVSYSCNSAVYSYFVSTKKKIIMKVELHPNVSVLTEKEEKSTSAKDTRHNSFITYNM